MSVKVVMSLGRCVNRIVVLQLSSFLCNTKTWAAQSKSLVNSRVPGPVKIVIFGYLKLNIN